MDFAAGPRLGVGVICRAAECGDLIEVNIRKYVLGRQVQFGGDKPVGWLPSNSALPRPTPVVSLVLDVRILEDAGGFILEWQSRNSSDANDSWHATLDDAESQARINFGIEASEWQEPRRDL